LAEELGDVLLEVVFLARMAKEKKKFTISDVLDGINKKMIRRHPHVFGPKHVPTSAKVREQWNDQKQAEKDRESLLDGLTKSSPALLASFQIGLRASSCGFDWKESPDALQKVKEEVVELEEALKSRKKEEVSREIGDMLFSMANVSRLLGVNPEIALREANRKFIRRFRFVEKKVKERGQELGDVGLEVMDRFWDETKKS
jgi:MazG family protein